MRVVAAVEHALEVVAVADADEDAGGRCRPARSGAMPACSSASQATSSSRRCCGSIVSASRGEMPKNAASKPSTPSRKPPLRGPTSCPARRDRGRSRRRRPSGRRAPRRSRRRRRAAAARTPPGRRRRRGSGSRCRRWRSARVRAAGRLELLVQLERQQRQPLGRQLADAVEEVAASTSGLRSGRAASRRSTSSSDRSSIAVDDGRTGGDRLAAPRRSRSSRPVANESREQMVGQRVDRRVVEQQRRRQRIGRARAPSVLRSSTAISESSPSSPSGVPRIDRRAAASRPSARSARSRTNAASSGAAPRRRRPRRAARCRLAVGAAPPAVRSPTASGRAPASSLRKARVPPRPACCGVTRASRPAAPRPAPRPARSSRSQRLQALRRRDRAQALAPRCARRRRDRRRRRPRPGAPVDAQARAARAPGARAPARRGRRWPRRGWPAPASRAPRRPTRTARRSRAHRPRVSSSSSAPPRTLGAEDPREARRILLQQRRRRPARRRRGRRRATAVRCARSRASSAPQRRRVGDVDAPRRRPSRRCAAQLVEQRRGLGVTPRRPTSTRRPAPRSASQRATHRPEARQAAGDQVGAVAPDRRPVRPHRGARRSCRRGAPAP